jgi:hypothetical protein
VREVVVDGSQSRRFVLGMPNHLAPGERVRAGNEALSRTLGDAGVRHTFIELPGPHDQNWLRSSGTERMLAWFDAPARP